MPKAIRVSLFFACEQVVENAWKAMAQTFKLITYSTGVPLNISHNGLVVRFFSPRFAQSMLFFAHTKMSEFNLLGGQFYSFSSGPINTNKLNRGF